MLETIINEALREYKVRLQQEGMLDNSETKVLKASEIQNNVKNYIMNKPIKDFIGKGM